tara:strand:+ start:242 stop:1093 length:852 start_codon:yes stop_codon:yes gene_type:complete
MTGSYASPEVDLYVNALNRTMLRNGITKSISDDYWTSDINPILFPIWDSDRDRLETFVRYKDGRTFINKTKHQRDQKTGTYNWVSYEYKVSQHLPAELDALYDGLLDKYVQYKDIEEQDLEQELLAKYAKGHIASWTQIRLIRKFMLDESDWSQTLDAPINDEQKAQWATYRQKLRDIPQEQEGDTHPNDVKFPVTPTKFATLLEENTWVDESAATDPYLDNMEHFFKLNQTVYKKFVTRLVTYMAAAVSVEIIDDMPVTRVQKFPTANDLNSILARIEAGEI